MALRTVSKTRFVGWQWARSPCNSLWTHQASRKCFSLIRDVKNSCLLRCSPANTLCQAQERMNTVQTQYNIVWLAGYRRKEDFLQVFWQLLQVLWIFCLQFQLKTVYNCLDTAIMSASCWCLREVCFRGSLRSFKELLKRNWKSQRPFYVWVNTVILNPPEVEYFDFQN